MEFTKWIQKDNKILLMSKIKVIIPLLIMKKTIAHVIEEIPNL
jgi:hypothetical protein